jgi:hypothetical protein
VSADTFPWTCVGGGGGECVKIAPFLADFLTHTSLLYFI